MSSPFTPDQLASLSLQIEQQRQHAQLREELLQSMHNSYLNRCMPVDWEHVKLPFTGNEPDKQDIPDRLPVQWQAIAAVTKEEPRSFWQRFKKAAHNDLCEKDGVLNTQWRKWGDLSNETVLKSFGALLVGMGFSGNALQVLAVALAVIVIHIGCTAICEEA